MILFTRCLQIASGGVGEKEEGVEESGLLWILTRVAGGGGVLGIGTIGATFSLHLGRFGGDGVGGVRKQTFFRRAPSLDHSGENTLNYSLSVRV